MKEQNAGGRQEVATLLATRGMVLALGVLTQSLLAYTLLPAGRGAYAFYSVYTLPLRLQQLNPLIDAFAHRYNHFRRHDALDSLSPICSTFIPTASPPPSHMSRSRTPPSNFKLLYDKACPLGRRRTDAPE